MDEHFCKTSCQSLHGLLSDAFPLQNISRTSDWVDPKEIIKRQNTLSEDLLAKVALLELETRTEQTVTSETAHPRPEKIKTKRAAVQLGLQPEQPHVEEVQQPPTFTVSKCGFKVSLALFHNTISGNPPGEIAWNDFLSAMASVGFSIRKLDGSAWVFEPLSGPFRRSIIFHEPHPVNKIPYQTARRYGRRLERAYGWTGASFARG